ncbi:hypothetical protein IQ265_12800 [Nodosilinea sp. LEGE 06152]|uniref:hypothetical protein n=1 Tax=Nodosilinea sp. LEGE 06152 TaxID=2777966 RepID=UPI0018823241|nr:hypothetical protein [Nodosilinea sp. LEGE 06152]MBE9157698.1 hypothetical protein [Nodosilinea sp. LEGE 06152]
MVDFIRSTDMPPAIGTLEAYVAHGLLTLNNLFSALTYQELPGALLERVCDVNVVTAADGTIRLIGRVSLILDPAYVTGTGKLWTYVKEFQEAPIPAAYKVD